MSDPEVVKYEPCGVFTREEANAEAARRAGDENGAPLWRDTFIYAVLADGWAHKKDNE